MRIAHRTVAIVALLLMGACAPSTGAPELNGAAGKGDTPQQRLEQRINRPDDQIVRVEPIADTVFRPDVSKLAKPAHRLMSTADSFRRYFRADPPDGIFDNGKWVIFATPGRQARSGFATDLRINLHPSGNSLQAGIVTTAPAAGCGEAEIQRPYALGTIPAGAGRRLRPQSIRYYTRTKRAACAEPVCGEALMTKLREAAIFEGEEVLSISEADYPYEAIDLGPAPEHISIETVARAVLDAGVIDSFIADWRTYQDDFPASKEEILAKLLDDQNDWHERWGAFSSSISEETATDTLGYDEDAVFDDPEDDWERKHVLGHRQLDRAMAHYLTDVRTVMLFDIEVQVFFVGRGPCGRLVGYHTTYVWT